MIKKILKRTLIGVLALIVVLITAVSASAYLAMDRDYSHTNDTLALPLYSDLSNDFTSGVVRIEANGFEYRARIAGDVPGAPTVILLHGFPVTSAMWIPVIQPLSDAGYRVIAFDQRGYSPGARPEEQSAYSLPNLVSDVIAIADAVGADQFHLVGHDWGAGVGWSTVMQHGDRILSWTGVSIAHPAAFADALENDADQQARSGYFALFVTPMVPETLFTFNNLMVLKGLYSAMGPRKTEEYVAVFSEPRALTSSLNWYRQMGASLAADEGIPQEIDTPTLFIWGNNDESAGRAAVEGQAKYMIGPYRMMEIDGDHWLVNSHGREISQALIEHFAASD